MSHDNENHFCAQVISRQSGFDLHISNYLQTLLTFSEAYSALGYSVIPLLGDLDPTRPKVPAVAWSTFQAYPASAEDHHHWFADAGFSGLGIVTGRISKLVVLDFDSEQSFADFRACYPDLLDTHTVRSAGRQLPHLYFRLPPHLSIPSQKGQGIDLLSDGRYAVAPPTTISGTAYKVVHGGMPKLLTEHDLRRIQSFLMSHKLAAQPTTPIQSTSTQPVILPLKSTSGDLERIYQHHCQKGTGRNDALFRTSLYARDTGWTATATLACLVSLHTHLPASDQHIQEAPVHRQREASATIRSAFSRMPSLPRLQGQVKIGAKENKSFGLPNSIREALIQQGMTFFVRTYEGLLHQGIQPGQTLLAKHAIEQLSNLVGRDSVWNALKAVVNGKRLFCLPVSPTYGVVTDPNLIGSKNAFFEGCKNQEKPCGGRPTHHFRMPTTEELCELLGVKKTSSDLLEQADLVSASKTRMALHRELIKRRPGVYPLGWLARRLGVNRRTIATYNRLIPIHSREMHIETTINWSNLERLLPMDEPIQGAVLVGKGGKRYPALRIIASRCLARAEVITLKQQTANFYWYGDTVPLLTQMQIQQERVVQQERVEAFIAKQPRQVTEPPKPSPQPVIIQPKPPKNLHRQLKNAEHEAQAQALYQTMSQISPKCLSIANARRLTTTYPAHVIKSALGHLQNHQRVTNPVGFFISFLRSTSKMV